MGSYGFSIPPVALRNPTSVLPERKADREGYLERGAETKRAIVEVLGPDWSWSGRRVLDFGCGSGRVLRHFHEEAAHAEFWGSDIDAACIAWDGEHLDPPMSFVTNAEVPPLPFPDEHFDLVYAMSVFTHITDHWAAWLMELHRVLVTGGVLLATFMGEGMSERVAGETWDETRVGMNVYLAGQRWEVGGPMVLHSPWWIEEHWGRLFDVERIVPAGFVRHEVNDQIQDHGAALLRKGVKSADVTELTRTSSGEPREVTALASQVLDLRSEVATLRAEREASARPVAPAESIRPRAPWRRWRRR